MHWLDNVEVLEDPEDLEYLSYHEKNFPLAYYESVSEWGDRPTRWSRWRRECAADQSVRHAIRPTRFNFGLGSTNRWSDRHSFLGGLFYDDEDLMHDRILRPALYNVMLLFFNHQKVYS